MSNLNERMWPDRGSNQRTLDSQSDSLPIALGGPAFAKGNSQFARQIELSVVQDSFRTDCKKLALGRHEIQQSIVLL